MEPSQLSWITNFVWDIADDVLRDLYVRGKYRDAIPPMICWSCGCRVAQVQNCIFDSLNPHEKEFLEFVQAQYIATGFEELAIAKLPELLTLKYFTLPDAISKLGNVEKIRSLFIGFQKYLYLPTAA